MRHTKEIRQGQTHCKEKGGNEMTKEQARNVLDEGGNYWHIYPHEIEIVLDGSFTVAELEAAIFLIKEKQGNQTRIKNSGQLKAAGIERPKPIPEREYKKGDKVRVTATPSPTYPCFSVGDVATLTRFNGCDWLAVFASGKEWCLQPSFGTRYEFFNESKPKDRRTRIRYNSRKNGGAQ